MPRRRVEHTRLSPEARGVLMERITEAARRGNEQDANALAKTLLLDLFEDRWEPRIVFYPGRKE